MPDRFTMAVEPVSSLPPSTFPYLTPPMFADAEAFVLKSISGLGPEFLWVSAIPATHLDTILIQWLCNKVNAFTKATPPAA